MIAIIIGCFLFILYLVLLHIKFYQNLYIDSVTGFLKSAKFETEVSKELLKKNNSYYIIMDIDFRNFKYTNKTFGKSYGNILLKKTANYIEKTLAEVPHLLARGYADHFYAFIKLQNNPEYYTYIFLQQYYDADYIKKKLELLIKVGIVFVNPSKEQDTVENLLGKASYAKRFISANSQTPFMIFDKKIEETMNSEAFTEKNFLTSLKNNEFIVMYQPQIDMNTGKITGAEALVRRKNHSYGLMEPSMFLKAVEESGNIRKLDYYVYECVFKFIRSQLDKSSNIVPISLNMSRQHLDSENFIENLSRLIQKYRIPPRLLKIEILERACTYETAQLKKVIQQLKKIGITTAIDDFGTGESSLGMLTEIPVDEIKLDRLFVNFIGSENGYEERNLEKVTKSILTLSKQLGKKTLCEGVETQKQIDFLKTVPCDTVQGFYYSKPLNEYNFIQFLQKFNKKKIC